MKSGTILLAAFFLSFVGHTFGNMTMVDPGAYLGNYLLAGALQLAAIIINVFTLRHSIKLRWLAIVTTAFYALSLVYYLLCTARAWG